MNMDDFFAMGFCKAAEEHGVDPVQLAKYAQAGRAGIGPLVGNDARNAVQALYDNGYITHMHTPWRSHFLEWFKSKIPYTAHWQYASNYPGYIATVDKPGETIVNAVPSRLRTAQVLEKHPEKMSLDDWRVLDDVKAHRPISAADHGQMMDAIERANPEAAARHGYVTVGKTAPKEYRAAREVTDALSEGVASGGVKLPAKVKPAATMAAKATSAAGNASRLKALSKLLRRIR